jgi:hypothetical protein
VSTTIRFTVAAGAASVMEEAVAVVVVPPVPVVPVPVVPVPVVPVPVVPVVDVVTVVLLIPVDAVLAVAGVAVMPSLPQPAKATDSAAMTHRSLPVEKNPRKVSYIALLPEAMSAASRWWRR